MTQFSKLLCLFVLVLIPSFVKGQVVSYKIPQDTSILTLTKKIVLESQELRIEVEEGTAIISKGKLKNYELYEKTLISARDRLVLQNEKINDMLNTIASLEEKLSIIDTIANDDLSVDIAGLQVIQDELEGARNDLKQSNNELGRVTTELEKTTKKLAKKNKADNIIKVGVGAAGLVLGILIGNVL